MSCIYRGVHETLTREVAIKELLSRYIGNKEARLRFEREAIVLSGFRHQNIVTLYDLIEKNDALYMIMELVDGFTLADLLESGPLPPVVAAVIGARIASALDHAHFHRIIHRDVKPSNVMITRAGEVKLMDFGIAKDPQRETLTQEGMTIGTPSYMSPEQVTGEKIDPRTDIFSLGVLLYECLSGQRPFVGSTPGEVFARIRDGKCLPLQQASPDASKELARIVTRAMKVDIKRRYFDAALMRRDLEVFIAKRVRVSQAALLISFLAYVNKLSETEVLARITNRELKLATVFGRKPRRAAGLMAFALAVVGLVGTIAFFAARYLGQSGLLPQ